MENDQPEDYSSDVTVSDMLPEVLIDDKPKKIRKKAAAKTVVV